ncbi:nickel-dependent hydrogenase large subunit [Clostridium sp. ZBS2]|uniref:nickel-dependent hydrogenase large subunit n=1 Tax=Clostridium sp. ZBS2 TaxID=2949976 RepID=UPI00207994C6|nr:nickel-dependent hydrogenase large subunit [Clostridium sp. ZBS2]
MTKIIIDPITRVSGLLSIEVEIENNKIIDAKSSGSQFRGFEQIFQGRSPLDIIYLAPRICGICSTHHTMAATLALEDAMKVTPDFNGKIVRDIANGFELLQNYLRHIYLFVFPDYVDILHLNPLYKTESAKQADYRLSKADTDRINSDYLEAVKYSREAHRGVAELAGKVPHCHGIFVGGTTTNINIQQIENIKYSINVISSFVEEKLIPDVYRISEVYNDYFKIGKGHGNLMCYELYNDYSPPIKYCAPGVIINGVKETFDINNITESVAKTWANGTSETIIPGLDEPAKPNAYKENAYSWINAPRYNGHAMEVGALARMTLNGGYSGGISTMDRIAAKSLEAKRICETIKVLIEMLKLGKAYQKEWEMPEKAKGIGLIEAERGALGHWLSIDKKLVSNYTLIPPSAWNLSPEDSKGIKGTAEQALIGTQINDIKYPVEIGRIVRSFDPCLNCAAHIVSDRYEPFNINIV